MNTCAFIEDAKQEAIDTLLEAAELKNGRLKTLLVRRLPCTALRRRGDVRAAGGGRRGRRRQLRQNCRGARERRARRAGPCIWTPNDAPVQEAERLVCTGPAWAYLLIAEGWRQPLFSLPHPLHPRALPLAPHGRHRRGGEVPRRAGL